MKTLNKMSFVAAVFAWIGFASTAYAQAAAAFTQPSPWLSANFAALGDDNTRIPPDVQGAAGYFGMDSARVAVATSNRYFPKFPELSCDLQ